MAAARPGSDDGAAPSSDRFAHYERVADEAVDRWGLWLRRSFERVREQAEDLWAEAQNERARRAG